MASKQPDKVMLLSTDRQYTHVKNGKVLQVTMKQCRNTTSDTLVLPMSDLKWLKIKNEKCVHTYKYANIYKI